MHWVEGPSPATLGLFVPHPTAHVQPALDAEYIEARHGTNTFVDQYLHPNPEEQQVTRLGNQLLPGWHWRDDATAVPPRVASYTNTQSGTLRTAGIWWDHVVLQPGVYASGDGGRDASFEGKLRSHYAYVETPNIAPKYVDVLEHLRSPNVRRGRALPHRYRQSQRRSQVTPSPG